MSLSSEVPQIWSFMEVGRSMMFALTIRYITNAMEQWDALWRFSFAGASV
jgi:hypothetical protein